MQIYMQAAQAYHDDSLVNKRDPRIGNPFLREQRVGVKGSAFESCFPQGNLDPMDNTERLQRNVSSYQDSGASSVSGLDSQVPGNHV